MRRLDRAFTELNLELTYTAWLIRAFGKRLKFNYAAKPFGAAQIRRIFDDKFKAKSSLNLRGQLKAKAALAHPSKAVFG